MKRNRMEPYRGQLRAGSGCPAEARRKKRRSSGRMAPGQPQRKRLNLLMGGVGSAPEEMAGGHEVDDALQVGTADGVQDAEEEREDERARQNGVAVVLDGIGGVLSDSHNDSSS